MKKKFVLVYCDFFSIHVFRDNWGRKWCHLVAIDAIYFRDPSTQYSMKCIKRELIKAYTGFYSRGQSPDSSFPIATGNWGCGAFNGDRQLKGMNTLCFFFYKLSSLM